MRRGRTLIFLLLILIVGLVVAYVGIRALRPLLSPAPPVPQDVQVFVAGQNIPQGGKITEDVLTTIVVPADKVSTVEFTVDEKSQLVGRVAKFPLDQGVVITSSMVTDSAAAIAIAGPQHAALIPPGMTAASIPASRLSLNAYGISDGAHVNVKACFLFVDVDPKLPEITPNKISLVYDELPQGPAGLPLLSRPRATCRSVDRLLLQSPSIDIPKKTSTTAPVRRADRCRTRWTTSTNFTAADVAG